MQDNMKKIVASAAVSSIEASDLYLTIKARMFDVRTNLNGVRVTEGFLDEIVENESKYICIPLCADVRGLLSNRTIGHMYDSRTGEFHSTQVGSFYHFEKEVTDDNIYLVGYARVMKRNKAICSAISELFAENALKFSFEITCASYEQLDDGTLLIDADPKNYLEGEAIVTFPACEDATALELVAECLGKGDENMADDKEMIAEEIQTETAEVSEEVSAETAERIIVHEDYVERDEVRTYNCDTGEQVSQAVTVETRICTPVEIAEESDSEVLAAETDEEETEDSNEDTEERDEQEDEEIDASCGKNKKKNCAEDTSVAELKSVISELMKSFDALRNEIAELKADKQAAQTVEQVAEQTEEIVAEMNNEKDEQMTNPFMASMALPTKYSLLNKVEKPSCKYSLLEKA